MKYRHTELSWNIKVHGPLLSEALQGLDSGAFTHAFDYLPCHTARIDHRYLTHSVPEKWVDFCVCFDPESPADPCRLVAGDAEPSLSQSPLPDSRAVERIHHLRRRKASSMINHAVLDSIQHRPLVLSIETKRPGEELDKATLQMSAWQSAHWNSLLHLITLSRGEDDTAPLTQEAEAALLQGLPFLPAIIIQGNAWYFAASTREKRITVRPPAVNAFSSS